MRFALKSALAAAALATAGSAALADGHGGMKNIV